MKNTLRVAALSVVCLTFITANEADADVPSGDACPACTIANGTEISLHYALTSKAPAGTIFRDQFVVFYGNNVALAWVPLTEESDWSLGQTGVAKLDFSAIDPGVASTLISGFFYGEFQAVLNVEEVPATGEPGRNVSPLTADE